MAEDTNQIRILTVDDHAVVRDGIAALVGTQSDMKIVGEASNGNEAIDQFRALRPDVVLMDIHMPDVNGIEGLIAIRKEFPDARVIVLTTYKGDVQAKRALEAGAQAYLFKNLLRHELLTTIRDVHAGRKRIGHEVAEQLAEHFGEHLLTAREIDVLRLVAEGNSNKLTAVHLSVTEDTVKGHVRNIMSKLGASDRTHAVTIGLRRGIIEL